MKSAIVLLVLFTFAVVIGTLSAFDMAEWKAEFKKSMDDLKEKVKKQVEEAKQKAQEDNKKMMENTEEIWAGYGSILHVDNSGAIVSASLDSRRLGADVPETAYDLTEQMAVHSCKTVTLPKFSTQMTMCGGPDNCKSLTTHRSMATVCPGSISTSVSSGVLTMIRDKGSFGPNSMVNASVMGSGIINGSIFGK